MCSPKRPTHSCMPAPVAGSATCGRGAGRPSGQRCATSLCCASWTSCAPSSISPSHTYRPFGFHAGRHDPLLFTRPFILHRCIFPARVLCCPECPVSASISPLHAHFHPFISLDLLSAVAVRCFESIHPSSIDVTCLPVSRILTRTSIQLPTTWCFLRPRMPSAHRSGLRPPRSGILLGHEFYEIVLQYHGARISLSTNSARAARIPTKFATCVPCNKLNRISGRGGRPQAHHV